MPYLRRNIGVVFQDYKLLPNRTVYDNVAYSLQVIGETRQEIRRKVPDILRLVGLSTKLHNFPDELSGGEQQRVSIARAFVNHPPLLLADEPTGNLDPETSIGIMQLIYRINRTGTTVVVATHDKEMVDKMRRRVVELREGRIVRDEQSGLYRPDESTTEFAIRLRGELGVGAEGPPELAMRLGFFLREALRGLRRSSAPGARRAAHGPAHRAGARRVHPDRAGHHRHGQRGARPGGGGRLREATPATAEGAPTSCGEALEGTTNVKSVEFISKGEALARAQEQEPGGLPRGSRAARREPAARLVPRHARGPGQARPDRRPPGAGRHAASWPRSTRCATARRRPTRSSPPPAS